MVAHLLQVFVPQRPMYFSSNQKLNSQEVLRHSVLLILTLALSLSIAGRGGLPEAQVPNSRQEQQQCIQILGWVLFALLLLLLLLSRSMNLVFIFFSALRSPLFSTKPTCLRSITNTLLLLLHPLLSSLLLLSFSLLTCSTSLTTTRLSYSSSSSSTLASTLARLAEVMSVVRMLRWLWQDTSSALWEAVTFTLLRWEQM